MKHTSARSLIIAAFIGAGVVWLIEVLLVSVGEPMLVPPRTWSAALVILGGAIMALAWPIRSWVQGNTTGSIVDPFYATRVVLLAKSMSVGGAGVMGGALGILVFLVSRPVLSPDGLWLSGAAVVGAIVLMVGGMVAERWCTLPPGTSEGDTLVAPEGESG
jgi:hypothetical protein